MNKKTPHPTRILPTSKMMLNSSDVVIFSLHSLQWKNVPFLRLEIKSIKSGFNSVPHWGRAVFLILIILGLAWGVCYIGCPRLVFQLPAACLLAMRPTPGNVCAFTCAAHVDCFPAFCADEATDIHRLQTGYEWRRRRSWRASGWASSCRSFPLGLYAGAINNFKIFDFWSIR